MTRKNTPRKPWMTAGILNSSGKKERLYKAYKNTHVLLMNKNTNFTEISLLKSQELLNVSTINLSLRILVITLRKHGK